MAASRPGRLIHFVLAPRSPPILTASVDDADGSTSERFHERIMSQLGPDALRRLRADFLRRDRIGRLEDRQGGPEAGPAGLDAHNKVPTFVSGWKRS